MSYLFTKKTLLYCTYPTLANSDRLRSSLGKYVLFCFHCRNKEALLLHPPNLYNPDKTTEYNYVVFQQQSQRESSNLMFCYRIPRYLSTLKFIIELPLPLIIPVEATSCVLSG